MPPSCPRATNHSRDQQVDHGLFKKYGLDLQPILFRGSAESTHALSGGEIQFDVVSPQPHIAADLSGAEIIIIGTYFNEDVLRELDKQAFVKFLQKK